MTLDGYLRHETTKNFSIIHGADINTAPTDQRNLSESFVDKTIFPLPNSPLE